MLEREILGEKIWEADDENEARQLWRDHPEDRGKIWFHDEVRAYYLAGPEEWAAAIVAKKAKPGKLPNIPAVKADIEPTELSSHCRRTGKWCSETPCTATCE